MSNDIYQDSAPKCKHPECNNTVTIRPHKPKVYKKFCSQKCRYDMHSKNLIKHEISEIAPICAHDFCNNSVEKKTTGHWQKYCSDKCQGAQYSWEHSDAYNSEPPKCANPDCDNLVTIGKYGHWHTYCSRDCAGQYNSLKSRDKSRETCMKNYGVDNAFKSEEIKDLIKETCLEKYGYEYASQSPEIKERVKNTCLERFGVEYPMYSDELQEQVKQTCFKNHGVYYPMQDPAIAEKSLKSALSSKDYILPSGKIIKVQGYEPWALDLILKDYIEEDIIIDKTLVPNIQYKFEDKNCRYYTDIYVPKDKLMIEVKSDWTYNKELERNLAKKEASILAGYNFKFFVFDGKKNLVIL